MYKDVYQTKADDKPEEREEIVVYGRVIAKR